MASLKKRKTVKRKFDTEKVRIKKPKTAITQICPHTIEDNDESPSYYQILVNSLPKASMNQFDAMETTAIYNEVEKDDQSINESHYDDEVQTEDLVSQVESFSTHFEYNLTDNEVKTVSDLFINPLTFQTEQSNMRLFRWLSTSLSRNEWTGPNNDSKQYSLRSMHVREPMASNWKGALNPLQSMLFNAFNSYKDVIFSCRTADNASDVRRMYLLHLLNHVIKSRARVLKNNSKLANLRDQAINVEDCDEGDFKDQGLIRPKILILVPFKSCAVKLIEDMSNIMFSTKKAGGVANRKRFMEEFGCAADSKPPDYKPKSYLDLFDGNTNDCFKLGISIKKNSINLYKKFYSSDVIIASPLGLRIVIGAQGDKERDYDFLSSLEMVIVDQMDVYLMQNWDHLLHIFDHIHLQPKEGHGVDFSRVREWALNGNCKYYCQHLFFSDFLTPEINSMVSKCFRSYEGQIRVTTPVWEGSVHQVVRPISQVFQRFNSQSCKDIAEDRFMFFTNTVLPKLSQGDMDQTCIYIPSYFDFIRVRNHFKKENKEFVVLSEYSKQSSISRAKSYFSSGHKRLLLMTERLHFFRRYRIHGIRHLVFYGLPTYQEFYSELVNMIEVSRGPSSSLIPCTVLSLYCEYDILALQRIVGTGNTRSMLRSSETMHTIITDNKY